VSNFSSQGLEFVDNLINFVEISGCFCYHKCAFPCGFSRSRLRYPHIVDNYVNNIPSLLANLFTTSADIVDNSSASFILSSHPGAKIAQQKAPFNHEPPTTKE
jgi:hypothetical protein